MSFLDHFRRKPSELAKTPATQPGNAEQKIAANAVDERSSPVPATAPRDTGTAPAPVTEEKPTPVPPETKPEEPRIRFCVGDFLHRIPHQLLKPGQHDITFEVSFDASDVADRIAQGHTTIALVEVYKRAPHIFRREIREADNVEIRFPWQKLMSFIKPETGISKGQAVRPAAANTLAARLRSRQPAPRPAPTELPKASDGSATGESEWAAKAPIGQQASSDKVEERPTPSADPAVGGETPAAPSASRAPVEAGTPPPAPTEATTEPVHPQPATVSAAKAQQPMLDLGLAQEKNVVRLDRGREQAVPAVELSHLKAEHSRQLAVLAREHDRMADERSKLQHEVEALRKTAAEIRQQLDEQKNVATQRHEEMARAERARLELQTTIDQRTAEVAELQGQIDRLKTGNDEAIKTIAQERDALLQQKAHLSEQLTTVRHGRSGPSAPAVPSMEPAVRGGQVERSKREYQRQIEELQRRITAFESSQKESAHELTRERESRIKVERALAAAERARAEATALVENMRAEMRRDLESGFRKRESELARTQQEMQEQLDAANRSHEDVRTERQQLLAQIAELQTTAAAEREKLRARIAELEQSTPLPASVAPPQTPVSDWESRAVARLESDVAGYRERIKALLQEREQWNQERARLSAGASGRVTEYDDALRQWEEQRNKHSSDLHQLESQLRAAIDERDQARQLIEKTEQAHAVRAAETTRMLDELRRQISTHESTIAALRTAATASDSAVHTAGEQLQEESRTRIGELEKAIAALRQENSALAERAAAAQTAADDARQILVRREDEMAREKQTHQQQLTSVAAETERKLDEIRRDRAALDAEQQALHAALANARESQKAEAAALARESAAATQARNEALAVAEHARAAAEAAAERAKHEQMQRQQLEADLNARFERELARHRRERDLLERQRDALRDRLLRMGGEESDLLDEISARPTTTAAPSLDLLARAARAEELEVIDITVAEVVNTPEPEGSVQLPQIRPVQTRPPEVRAG